ncbi:hypothetical protein BWI17_20090 [Betaproteobacteria bacterium GR16-43]|nr:hypothetical protein BWI17_20090 [Betaproteobacteria bacterium GR16-43]
MADHDFVVRARLAGTNEVPAVSSSARGAFEVRIARDGLSIAYTLDYSGLQGQVRQAHIHVAQRNVNGAIVLWLCGTPTNPGPAGTQTCPATGTVTGTLTATDLQVSATQQVTTFARVIEAIQDGVAYANVHTDLSPGGEIRGQLGSRSGH